MDIAASVYNVLTVPWRPISLATRPGAMNPMTWKPIESDWYGRVSVSTA